MLTREKILAKLEENANWEPPMEATDEEWDLYEEVRQELLSKKSISTDEEYDDDDDDDDEFDME